MLGSRPSGCSCALPQVQRRLTSRMMPVVAKTARADKHYAGGPSTATASGVAMVLWTLPLGGRRLKSPAKSCDPFSACPRTGRFSRTLSQNGYGFRFLSTLLAPHQSCKQAEQRRFKHPLQPKWALLELILYRLGPPGAQSGPPGAWSHTSEAPKPDQPRGTVENSRSYRGMGCIWRLLGCF